MQDPSGIFLMKSVAARDFGQIERCDTFHKAYEKCRNAQVGWGRGILLMKSVATLNMVR